MIYIIHGENLSQSRSQILNIQNKTGVAAKSEIDLTDLTPQQLVEKLSAFDIFGTPPFIVVNIGNMHFSKFESYIKEFKRIPQEGILIILADKELSKSNAFIKAAPALKAQIIYNPQYIPANIFRFIDVLYSKNRNETYKELNQLLRTGQDPFYLFSMILYGLRNIAFAKFNSPSFSKIAPFAKGKAISQAKIFEEEHLIQLFNDFYELDKGVKTGGIAPELLITVSIEKILESANN